MMLSIFSCACWPSVCLLWRNVYLGLCPFFNWFILLLLLLLLSCIKFFYPFGTLKITYNFKKTFLQDTGLFKSIFLLSSQSIRIHLWSAFSFSLLFQMYGFQEIHENQEKKHQTNRWRVKPGSQCNLGIN